MRFVIVRGLKTGLFPFPKQPDMWVFAGRPPAAAGGLPLYGIIPGGSYLKTLIHTSKKHDDFSRFPPGIIDVLLWRIPIVFFRIRQ